METYRIRNQNYLVQLHVHICAEVVINLLELSRCSFLALLRAGVGALYFPQVDLAFWFFVVVVVVCLITMST